MGFGDAFLFVQSPSAFVCFNKIITAALVYQFKFSYDSQLCFLLRYYRRAVYNIIPILLDQYDNPNSIIATASVRRIPG